MANDFEFDSYDWLEFLNDETNILKGVSNTNLNSDDSIIMDKGKVLELFEEFKKEEFKKLPDDLKITEIDSNDVSDLDTSVSSADVDDNINFLYIVPHVFNSPDISIVSCREVVFLFLKFSIEIYRCALLSAFSRKYYDKNYINNFEGVGIFVTRDDLNYVDDIGINDGLDFLRDHIDDMILKDTNAANPSELIGSVEVVKNEDIPIDEISDDIKNVTINEELGKGSKRPSVKDILTLVMLLGGLILIVVGCIMIFGQH